MFEYIGIVVRELRPSARLSAHMLSPLGIYLEA